VGRALFRAFYGGEVASPIVPSVNLQASGLVISQPSCVGLNGAESRLLAQRPRRRPAPQRRGKVILQGHPRVEDRAGECNDPPWACRTVPQLPQRFGSRTVYEKPGRWGAYNSKGSRNRKIDESLQLLFRTWPPPCGRLARTLSVPCRSHIAGDLARLEWLTRSPAALTSRWQACSLWRRSRLR